MPISRSFGEYLRQFALSVDFIESNHYEQAKKQISDYLQSQLEAGQVALFEPYIVGGQPALRSVWSSPQWDTTDPLRRDDAYTRQIALAIGEQRNLWVVSENNEPLSDLNRGIDLWTGQEDAALPPFPPSPGRTARSSIILTTRDARDRFNGSFLIELERKVLITVALKEELASIAQAVGLLHATAQLTQEQRVSTHRALSYLGHIMQTADLDLGARPPLFFAHSERAPEPVLAAIDEVLSQYEDHVHVHRWKSVHEPGNIPSQITKMIQQSKYGICYLSEPESVQDTQPESQRFRDNPNVLLEAGMLHIATSNASDATAGWVPIREKNSPGLPFDLVGQRRITVPRDDTGNLKLEEFKEELSAKLTALLTDEDDRFKDHHS
ncbi:MAG: hypothetical protein WBD47_04280 [Phormidesmis sp.]